MEDLRSHLKLLSELHLLTSSCRTLWRCRQLSAGQTLSGAAAKTPPEEQSLQAGEPRITMLGFLHFMLSYSPLSPSFHSLASQRASKGRVTLPHPLFAKHTAFPPPPASTVFFHLQTPNLSHQGPNAIAPYLLTPRPRLRKQEAPGRVPSVLAAACFVCEESHRRPPSRRCLVYFVPVRTQRWSCGVLDLLLSTNQRTCSCLFEFLLGCIGFTDSRGAI